MSEEQFKKYLHKPLVVEAYQTDKEMEIETLEGTMKACEGDYIIKGIKGELYPCKEDIFHEIYDDYSDKTQINPYIVKSHLWESRNALEQLIAYYDSLLLAVDPPLSDEDEGRVFGKMRRCREIIGKINMELENEEKI